jgi:hypothetical protein
MLITVELAEWKGHLFRYVTLVLVGMCNVINAESGLDKVWYCLTYLCSRFHIQCVRKVDVHLGYGT